MTGALAPQPGPSPGRNELGGTVQGPVVQAQSIAGGVHIQAARPASLPVPAQLPPPPVHFTGRGRELALLDQCAAAQAAGRVQPLVITGAGGAGKTALALHWLHRISGRYPGGVLYADLGGHVPGAARGPGEVLTGFLRALDVPAGQIPLPLHEAAALFRSATATRRLIMLLDNPVSAAQVRALLPGSAVADEAAEAGGASLVVVTSRRRITGLAIDGAQFVTLGPLDEDVAIELLGRVAGVERVAREPDAAARLVRMCGQLPIAVCVCAARLVAHPQWGIQRIAGEMASERDRLTALSLEDDVSVRAACDLSYESLDPAAARMYCLAALVPGPDIGPELAGAATGTEPRQAGRLLEALADASLLEETGEQRYRFHDLLRLHARERAGELPSEERRAVVRRAVTWYLRRAVAIDRVIMPYRWRLNPMYQHSDGSPACAGPGEALDAQEAGLAGTVAAVRAAGEQGLHELAWQLCEALWGLFMQRKLLEPWISSHLTGLASAQACGHRRAQARMSVQLGAACLLAGRRAEARELFAGALELEQREGHQLGVATALEQLGRAELADDHPGEAIDYFTRARRLFGELGRPRAVALMGCCLGDALIAASQARQAIPELLAASRQFAALPDRYMHGHALTVLGRAYLADGQPLLAIPPLEEALAAMTDLGSAYKRGRIYAALASAAGQIGDGDRERACHELAQAAYAQAGAADPPR